MEFKQPELSNEILNARNPDVAWVQAWLNLNAGTDLEIDGAWGTVSRVAFINAFVCKTATKITADEMEAIALELGDNNTNRLRAVAVVESGGSGWFNSGLPKILWERHKFWQWVKNSSSRVVSWFANPAAGDYTMDVNKNGVNDSWEKLSLAIGKEPLAALQSISIGKFQVLGRYYRECGYNHPIEMLYACSRSEYAQYCLLRDYILKVANCKDAFLQISSNPNDCRVFAKAYNGAGYDKYDYHTKIAKEMLK